MCEDSFKDQSNPAILNCPAGSFVNLTYVNYGRTQPYSEVCDFDIGESRTDCPSTAAVTERAENLCQGQQTCRLAYTGLGLSDTCDGTYKYFDVRYTCVKPGKRTRI